MDIFTRFGDLIIRFASFLGALIMGLPKIPDKLREANSGEKKSKITANIKKNVSEISEKASNISSETLQSRSKLSQSDRDSEPLDSDKIFISNTFSPEEKERTILLLQISSAAFLVISILFLFNFLSIFLFFLLGIIIVASILYLLYKKVKLMYLNDFNAYRDFFLMYVAIGILLVILSSNTTIVMAFSFGYLPSLSIFILALIMVIGFYLVFRMRYYRNFTYGTVLEAGKKTAHIKVEYDIRSNVKPDLYIVENQIGAAEGEVVKVKTEGKILSSAGNKPVSIIKTVKRM